jgi:oligopeptide transport system substrate-binding protein
MNLVAGPLHSNVNLRQALAMAIDRKRLTAFMQFGQAPAYGFVPPGTWNYSPQSWVWKDLSDADRIAKSKQLYSQAGYSSATPLHLRLLYNSNPVIRNLAIASASMWKDTLGIDTELIQEEYRVFLETRHDKSKWEVGRFAWTADFNDASNFLDIFRRQSTNNEEGYANDRFDTLLDSAAANTDLNVRRSLLEQGELMLLDDYPIAPLYFFVSKRLVKPDLRGLRMNPLNQMEQRSLP